MSSCLYRTLNNSAGVIFQSELVTSKGYVPEEHRVVTEDEYILGVSRVRCRMNCCPEKVVYISTPLFMDSDTFVLDFANNSLAFILADHGFDVWIGNIRGTKYSRDKVGVPNASDTDSSFYDFTFVDAGLKDIPAGINYALKVTGQSRLFYLGHSQATAGMFALLSVRPEYNDKIIAMAAMCPFRRIACNVGQEEQFGILASAAHYYRALNTLRPMIGEFPPPTDAPKDLLCRISKSLCSYTMHLCIGTAPNLNHSRLSVYSKAIPASTSLKNMILLGQMSSRSCSNIQDVYDMDYDDLTVGWAAWAAIFNVRETNMRVYRSAHPRRFNASNVKIPVRIYYGEDDGYATASEAELLSRELPNYRGSFNLGTSFGHWDLIMPTYNSSHVDDAIYFMENFVVEGCNL